MFHLVLHHFSGHPHPHLWMSNLISASASSNDRIIRCITAWYGYITAHKTRLIMYVYIYKFHMCIMYVYSIIILKKSNTSTKHEVIHHFYETVCMNTECKKIFCDNIVERVHIFQSRLSFQCYMQLFT